MKLAFLIINYNDFETTEKLLNNIKNYQCIDKIVVVDNNSNDDSVEKLYKYKNEKIDIIKTKENKGYGAGINFGVKYLIEKIGHCYIIVSNPDIVIHQESDLVKLKNTFNDDIAIVGPIIREHEGYNKGWKIPTPLQDSILNLPYIHRKIRPKMLFYNNDYYKNKITNVETLSGCFFVINSNYLKQVDYFDENLFLYYEENVIGKKLQSINKKIVINTEVEVFHNHSISIDKSINKINKYKQLKKSQIYFQKKYNKANIFEKILLYVTSKTTLLFMYLYYLKK